MIDLVMITAGTGEGDEKHPPLGLLYVGSALREAGFDVHIHHVLPSGIEKAVREIVKDRPLFVGLSVLTGLTTYHAAKMSQRIREENRDIPIVWGGHHPTFQPEQCLSEDFIDIVCLGEGEETVVDLAQALDLKKPLQDVLSIGFKRDGEVIITNPRPRIDDLDKLTLDWSLLNLDNYIVHSAEDPSKRITSFYSSRGCPFACGFCSGVHFCGRTWRGHSADYVLNHLTYLKDSFGFNSFFFSDDNFMVDRSRAYKILDGMAKRGITSDTMDIRIDMLNEDMLTRLKEYGASGVFFGWESGSDRLLKLINKGFNIEEVLTKAKMLAKHPQIAVWASGIVGLPTETRDETMRTIYIGMQLHRTLVNGTVAFIRYMPLPGTGLLPLAVRDGFKMPAKTEDWKVADPQASSYNCTWLPWLTDKDIRNLEMTQELTRRCMTKTRSGFVLHRVVANVFTYLFRRRVDKQDFRLMVDLWLYKLLRKLAGIAIKAKGYGQAGGYRC